MVFLQRSAQPRCDREWATRAISYFLSQLILHSISNLWEFTNGLYNGNTIQTGDKVIGGLSTTQKSRLKNFYMNDEWVFTLWLFEKVLFLFFSSRCLPFQQLAEWYKPQWKK